MLYEREQPLEPKEPKRIVSKVCACCGEPLYEGDECYHIDDNWYCTDCVRCGITTAPYWDD